MTETTAFPSMQHWRYRLDDHGVGWLELDYLLEPVNRLALPVLAELSQILETLVVRPPKGLVFTSGKPTGFIAGADIKAFSDLRDTSRIDALIDQGCDLFDRIQALPFPTLALVRGHCLGGGLELALACTFILAVDDPRTSFALPEVRIGIFPGWGGAKRLPQRIGAAKALNLMLTGRSVNARQAVKLGLADARVPVRLMTQAAQQLVLGPDRSAKGGLLRTLAQHRFVQRAYNSLVHTISQRQLRRQDPWEHYPAPRFILQLWYTHQGEPRLARAGIHQLVRNPVTHNLLRVYGLQEKLKALARVNSSQETVKASRIHVIGAGVMGGDIAAWAALKGLQVTLHDQDRRQLARALQRAHVLFSKRLQDPRLVTAARDRLIPDATNAGVRLADVVIEAIVENARAKVQLYQQIEPLMRTDALLATNTSSLTLQELNKQLAHPQRFVGLHFFNPVARMPLVEIVAAPETGAAQRQAAINLADQLGKLPLPVASTPGFLVNAVLAPYILAAMRCVDQGKAVAHVDAAMLQFGMPMGPLELADTVGLDVIKAAGSQLAVGASLPACLEKKLGQGQLGRKSGQGFYRWKHGKPLRPKGNAIPAAGVSQILVNELLQAACKCLDEGVVSDPDLVDAGLIFGAGFAPFTGGPLHYRLTTQESN